MFPPPCLTVYMVFLGLKASLSHLQIYCWSSLLNNKIYRVFFVHVISSKLCDVKHAWLSTLSPVLQQLLLYCRLAFWLIKLVRMVWLILTNFLSTLGNNLHHLPDYGSDSTVPSTLYLQTNVNGWCEVGKCKLFIQTHLYLWFPTTVHIAVFIAQMLVGSEGEAVTLVLFYHHEFLSRRIDAGTGLCPISIDFWPTLLCVLVLV